MARLSDVEIAQAAAGAGFSGDSLVTAIAVALAESRGDAGNTTGDGGTSYGLWQIHWTVHPQFDRSRLTDPNYNAMAAFEVSNGGTYWHPWTTYFQGTYKQFLSRARAAVGAISGNVGDVPGDQSGDNGSTADSNTTSDLTFPASGGGAIAVVLVVLAIVFVGRQ